MNIPLKIDSYEIGNLIGEGATAEVYEVIQNGLGVAALKILKPGALDKATWSERFKREGEVLFQINSPYVVRILNIGEWEGRPYFAMERVYGETLESFVEKNHTFTYDESLQIAKQLTTAVGAIHKARYIHRDIKPSNIIYNQETKSIKVTDFGIARYHATETIESQFGGTWQYAAPEHLQYNTTNELTDIYSIGMCLFYLLIGHVPFDTKFDIGNVILSPHEVDPRVPVGLSNIVARCIAKDPEKRYQSTDELLTALNVYDSANQSGRLPSRRPRSRSSRTGLFVSLIIGLGFVSVLCFSGILLQLLHESHQVSFARQTASFIAFDLQEGLVIDQIHLAVLEKAEVKKAFDSALVTNADSQVIRRYPSQDNSNPMVDATWRPQKISEMTVYRYAWPEELLRWLTMKNHIASIQIPIVRNQNQLVGTLVVVPAMHYPASLYTMGLFLLTVSVFVIALLSVVVYLILQREIKALRKAKSSFDDRRPVYQKKASTPDVIF